MSKQPKPDATPDKRPAWVRWATNKQERFRTHYKLPFELLAQTAAQLLAGEGPAEGDDAMMHVHPPKHYYRIAERALMLLHACADTIGGNAQDWLSFSQRVGELKKLGVDDPKKFPMNFAKFANGIKTITGQTRTDRAEADYTSLLQAMNPFWSKAELSKAIEDDRKLGFTGERLLELKGLLEFAREYGELGKKKRPQKKA